MMMRGSWLTSPTLSGLGLVLVLVLVAFSRASAVVAAGPLRVAVVGGGVASAVLADELFAALPAGAAELTVFEAASRLGGRVRTASLDGVPFEMGGTVIYSGNVLMYNLTRSMGMPFGDLRRAGPLSSAEAPRVVARGAGSCAAAAASGDVDRSSSPPLPEEIAANGEFDGDFSDGVPVRPAADGGGCDAVAAADDAGADGGVGVAAAAAAEDDAAVAALREAAAGAGIKGVVRETDEHVEDAEEECDDDPLTLGVWDHVESGFAIQVQGRWLDAARVVMKYGPLSPMRMKSAAADIAKQFAAVYPALRQGRAFETAADLFGALGLEPLLRVNARDFFVREHGVTGAWADDFLAACTRVNYAQDPRSMNALAAAVAVVGSGEKLLNLRDGWPALVEKTHAAIGSRVFTACAVDEIDLADANADGASALYRVAAHGPGCPAALSDPAARSHDDDDDGADGDRSVDDAAATTTMEFDVVVLAAPLESTNLRVGPSLLELVTADEELGGSAASVLAGVRTEREIVRPYRRLYVSFVSADSLNEDYFGPDAPDVVLTADRGDRSPPFNAIAKKGVGASGRGVWKMFTTEPPTAALFDEVFSGVVANMTRAFDAYPMLPPKPTGGADPLYQFPFRMSRGLYYTGAIDAPFSCMESSAIAALNVVNHLRRDFPRQE